MCGEQRGHGHGYGYHFMGSRSHHMGCSSECDCMSKETRVKYLEAMKSKLEDRLKHIDENIEKIQMEDAEEA